MNHFPFDMPDEVIFELMDDDCADRNAEYYGGSDWERGFPTTRDFVNVQRLSKKRESFSASSRPQQPRKCPKCGHGPLMYVDDDHLYYTSGKLAGKLHGCA